MLLAPFFFQKYQFYPWAEVDDAAGVWARCGMAGRRGCQHAAGDELGHGGSGRQARKQRWFVPRPPVALAGAKSAGDGPAACGRRRRQGSDAEGAAGGEGGGMEVQGSCGSRPPLGKRRGERRWWPAGHERDAWWPAGPLPSVRRKGQHGRERMGEKAEAGGWGPAAMSQEER